MGVHIDWICPYIGILRMGKKFGRPPDPYEFSAVVMKNNNSIEIRGANSIGISILRERYLLRKIFNNLSVKSVMWRRIRKSGEEKIINIAL